MPYKRLSDIKSEPYWGLGRDRRVSIELLYGKDIIFFDFKGVPSDRGQDKIIVKFAYPESEGEMHTFMTSSAVVKDRLDKDKDKLPFVTTLKRKGKYTYFD